MPMESPNAGAPTVPAQPAGVHDRPAAPGFAAGSAPLPPPGSPPPTSVPVEPAGAWGPIGPPGPPPMPPRSGRGRKTALVIVSVVAGLLLVVGGVMTYLWLSTASELDETRADLTGQVNELNDTVAARDGEIDQLGDELQQTQDELSDAETALEGTENQVDALEDQQDQLRECLTLVAEANAAAEAGDQDAANSLLAQSEPICDEAFDALFGP